MARRNGAGAVWESGEKGEMVGVLYGDETWGRSRRPERYGSRAGRTGRGEVLFGGEA